jgi:hypothetical protein
MKRALLVVLLAIPALAGFECTVEVTHPDWTPGGNCEYWLDYPADNYCADANTVYMCDVDNRVRAWDCASACGDVAGTCAYDSRLGYDWCMCPDWQWAPGYSCMYTNDRDRATCAGLELTYCAETNVIGAIDCSIQCVEWYGAEATGSCGPDPHTGVNNCLCTFPSCDHAPYCADSLWLVQCDAGGTADEYVDCNAYCISLGAGWVKGVCDSGACLCG